MPSEPLLRKLGTWRPLAYLIVAAAALIIVAIAHGATAGRPAPAFTATDSNGKAESLAEYRGKYVVLEWTNRDCPYTRKHYDSGNMQRLQQQWTAKGVVWLSILSSAPGEQGYLTAEQENAQLARVHAHPTAAILDSRGEIGRLYGAKTTPDMFVIGPEGRIIYAGAIDDKPSTDTSDIAPARNYVSAALSSAMQHQPVAVATTRPYGCSVKYAE
jgi:peroxiredoxin